MLAALQRLLADRRYKECRNLAEETLRSGAQAMNEAAGCYLAIARASLGLGDALGAVKAGEQGQFLADTIQDGELEAQFLMELAEAYSRLRRYADEARVLERFLAMRERLGAVRRHEPAVWRALGQNCLRRGDYQEAVHALTEAMNLAEAAGDPQVAESSRRLLRSASIRAGRLDEVGALFAASRTFLKSHPEDRESLFWYWHDRSDWAMAEGKPSRAEKIAWQAVNTALGEVPLEFAGYMLQYRHNLESKKPVEAMRFACEARLCALTGGRFDLAYEAVEAMSGLIQTHGPSVMQGLASYYSRRGVNLYRYVPEQLIRPL